jgi:hypothetical protein
MRCGCSEVGAFIGFRKEGKFRDSGHYNQAADARCNQVEEQLQPGARETGEREEWVSLGNSGESGDMEFSGVHNLHYSVDILEILRFCLCDTVLILGTSSCKMDKNTMFKGGRDTWVQWWG